MNHFKVGFVKKKEGIVVLQGQQWTDFALDCIDPEVNMLHFIQEGDDSFYVTGYRNFGSKIGGYDRVEGRLSSATEFLPDLDEDDTIAIDVEDEHYDVGETRVEAVVGTNRFEYQFNLETWNFIVQNQEMKNGMNVVFTKKKKNRIQLMLFNEDGTHVTTGCFLGVTSLNLIQPTLSYDECHQQKISLDYSFIIISLS
ncbi:hypothetical protein Tco_0815126 [Tanacetum coccineum]